MGSTTDSRLITAAALQMQCTDSKHQNLNTALAQIESAAQQGANVVCLQELFASRYFCQNEDHQHFSVAEPIPGETTAQLADTARRYSVVIVAGLFERRAAGVFHNSAVVIDSDGRLAGVYRKMHIPDDPFYHEKFYFTPGDLGFRSFETRFARIGVCICWDQWFPEAARLTALSGAEILVFPTAIGWLEEDRESYGESQLDAWQTMMRSHAIANGLFVVAPNRVGLDDHIEFWGSSFICDPYGRKLTEASRDRSEVIVANCELNDIQTARTHWPFLRDRRIDTYQNLSKRWIDASN